MLDDPPQPLDPVAVIVKVTGPGGVLAEVVTVKVETWLAPELTNGLLLNEADAPVGSPEALSVEVQVPPLPLKLTVIDE